MPKSKTLSKDEIELVLDCIEQEGFDYCFNNYSNFKDLKDKKFHELREKMLAHQKEFKEYIKETAKKYIDDENYLLDILGF